MIKIFDTFALNLKFDVSFHNFAHFGYLNDVMNRKDSCRFKVPPFEKILKVKGTKRGPLFKTISKMVISLVASKWGYLINGNCCLCGSHDNVADLQNPNKDLHLGHQQKKLQQKILGAI